MFKNKAEQTSKNWFLDKFWGGLGFNKPNFMRIFAMNAGRGIGGLNAAGEAHTGANLLLQENHDLNDAISGISRLITRISDQKRVPNKATFSRIDLLCSALANILRSTAQLHHKLGLDKDPLEHGDASYYRELEAACRLQHHEQEEQ
jgi:hypothetical protein